jgi:hypothetical protein
MRDQQVEYENRIRQLRIDLGSLKDAYLKLEKHHVSKPDKYKRVLHEKNKEINSLERENQILKDKISENKMVEERLHDMKLKYDEEKLKNIVHQRDLSKYCK